MPVAEGIAPSRAAEFLGSPERLLFEDERFPAFRGALEATRLHAVPASRRAIEKRVRAVFARATSDHFSLLLMHLLSQTRRHEHAGSPASRLVVGRDEDVCRILLRGCPLVDSLSERNALVHIAVTSDELHLRTIAR